MATITESFSEFFTNLSKEMVTALTTSFGKVEVNTKNIDDLQKKLPHHFRGELYAMKKELNVQLKEKRKELGLLLTDSRFDTGITIVERTSFHLPKLSQDLDENSLLGYLVLLQTNNLQFTNMFQELLDWMNTLPQPEKKKNIKRKEKEFTNTHQS